MFLLTLVSLLIAPPVLSLRICLSPLSILTTFKNSKLSNLGTFNSSLDVSSHTNKVNVSTFECRNDSEGKIDIDL